MNANQIAIATTATAIFRKLLIREELGSTATIHKRIHQLKDAGFVSFDTLTSSEGASSLAIAIIASSLCADLIASIKVKHHGPKNFFVFTKA
ncbi:MAG: hypothetical protein EBS62_12455 [Betaproteobacteria bacterium]|nr:hypothetical protein [Betaproteobacteria bacterium]